MKVGAKPGTWVATEIKQIVNTPPNALKNNLAPADREKIKGLIKELEEKNQTSSKPAQNKKIVKLKQEAKDVQRK